MQAFENTNTNFRCVKKATQNPCSPGAVQSGSTPSSMLFMHCQCHWTHTIRRLRSETHVRNKSIDGAIWRLRSRAHLCCGPHAAAARSCCCCDCCWPARSRETSYPLQSRGNSGTSPRYNSSEPFTWDTTGATTQYPLILESKFVRPCTVQLGHKKIMVKRKSVYKLNKPARFHSHLSCRPVVNLQNLSRRILIGYTYSSREKDNVRGDYI